MMGIVVFAIRLAWLPAGGFEQIGSGNTGLTRVLDIAGISSCRWRRWRSPTSPPTSASCAPRCWRC
ncbi:hypothetical protein [Teichococcus aestuarii]